MVALAQRMRLNAARRHDLHTMADTPQNQSAAQAPEVGSTPTAPGTPSTSAPKPYVDPLDAAINEAFAGTDTQAPSTAENDEGKGSDADGEPKPDDAAEGKTTEATTLTDEELEAAMPESSEIDPETPPKGLENVPKPVWMRLKKQSEQIRTLKAEMAEGAVILQPSPLNPLADVGTIEDLDERIAAARADRDWAQKNPQGGTRKRGSKEIEVSEADAAETLAAANAILDADATTRQRILFRQQSRPWEKAQAVSPELFTKGSQTNRFVLDVVGLCPEIVQKIPEWEYLMACAAEGMKRVVEEGSKRVKYVRYELDPEGKIIPPKKPAGPEQGKAAEKAKQPPVTPSATRPPVRPAAASSVTSEKDILAEQPAGASSEDRLTALLSPYFK